MADPTGEADRGAPRLDFDRRLILRFHGSVITSDGGLPAYRELDRTLGLADTGADTLARCARGQERPTYLVGLLRQSVFGCLVGYEDVNDADRLWSATGRSRELPFLPARWAASKRSG